LLRLLPGAVLVAAVICGTQIVVGSVDTGSYVQLSPVGQGVLPAFDMPLQTGFWTFDFVQHPASELPVRVSCGSLDSCAVLGDGYFNSVNVLLPEATITTNAGQNWKSWLFPVSTVPFYPFISSLVCTGSVCLGPTGVGDAFAVMTISADGIPSVAFSHASAVGHLGYLFRRLSCLPPTTSKPAR
jgi:hypothetical protein